MPELSANPHYKLTEWAAQYGDVISLVVGGQTIIALSSAAAVKEILDVRGAISSNRPASYVVQSITDGYFLGLLIQVPTDIWKRGRRTMQTMLSPRGLEKFLPLQQTEVIRMCHDFLRVPDNFYTHIFRTTLSVMLYTVYGKQSHSHDSSVVQSTSDYTRRFLRIVEPGAAPPVDFLPFLKYIPGRMLAHISSSWGRWKEETLEVRDIQRSLFYGLYDECEERWKKGSGIGCYMDDVLDMKKELGFENHHELGYHGGILLDGGSDTSAGLLRAIVLALTAHPEVQQEAWKEIDRVVGDLRLPQYEDFASLPYIQAIIREVIVFTSCYRWRPVSPAGVPHVTTEDQVYKGFTIPKGSMILMNTWGVYHDPDFYDAPEEFRPERYLLTPNGTKVGVDGSDYRSTLSFGAGRRMCPGYQFANNLTALAVMHLLWGFEFQRAMDPKTGEVVPLDLWNFDLVRLLLGRFKFTELAP
ncbi:cytochrome P450 [Hymenopellis radicata]|nr:cytochrome P450 [Hymenopellis radicata]